MGLLVELRLASGMPRPLFGETASLFGIWLLERIASLAIDWPAVGFHRIVLLPDGVRLTLVPRFPVPAAVVGFAIGRAVRAEVEAAALKCCGLEDGGPVWSGETVVIVEPL